MTTVARGARPQQNVGPKGCLRGEAILRRLVRETALKEPWPRHQSIPLQTKFIALLLPLALERGIQLRRLSWLLAVQNRLGSGQTERGYIATDVTTDTLSRKSHADNRLGILDRDAVAVRTDYGELFIARNGHARTFEGHADFLSADVPQYD